MLDILDMVLRFIGIVLALGIAFAPAATFAVICTLPLTIEGWPWWKRLALTPVFAALAAVVLYVMWRAIRFAAGYTGSSEYPFHFVVRWFS